MLSQELPEHARISLEAERENFLKSLRGRSEAYDEIRACATRFMRAVGAPESVRSALEGLLVFQMKAHNIKASNSEARAIASAVKGERMRIRLALAGLLKDD